MIDFNNAAFISGCTANRTADENRARHACLGADLVHYGIEAIDANGVYKNVPERSYMVKATRFEDQINLKQLARRYEQESILWVWFGHAELWIAASGLYEPIGTIAETPDAAGDRTVLADGRVLSII
jgi:hypothetical protein